MALPFLFFDVGGTLLFFRPSLASAIARSCGELGLAVSLPDAEAAVIAATEEAGEGPSPVDFAANRRWWFTFLGTYLRTLGHHGRASEIAPSLWDRHQAGDWLIPADDTIPTLERLVTAGYRLGI